jgi:hypothetical protein
MLLVREQHAVVETPLTLEKHTKSAAMLSLFPARVFIPARFLVHEHRRRQTL